MGLSQSFEAGLLEGSTISADRHPPPDRQPPPNWQGGGGKQGQLSTCHPEDNRSKISKSGRSLGSPLLVTAPSV